MTPAAVVRRILFYGLITLLSLFFALPLLWLVLAPFDKTPTLTVKIPDFTLDNFGAQREGDGEQQEKERDPFHRRSG